MKLAEIAERIRDHLKRIEADANLNKRLQGGTLPFWNSGCWTAGRYVYVQYVSYQGYTALSKNEALGYLAWLDNGNAGKHYLAIESAKEQP